MILQGAHSGGPLGRRNSAAWVCGREASETSLVIFQLTWNGGSSLLPAINGGSICRSVSGDASLADTPVQSAIFYYRYLS
jgi:hypothetical protein